MLCKMHCTQAEFHIPTWIKPSHDNGMTMTGTGNQTHFIRYKKSSSIQALGDSQSLSEDAPAALSIN